MSEATEEPDRRAKAARATLAQFEGKPFKLGSHDCARMVAAHLRRCGHSVQLPPTGSYRTVRGAMKALDARGAKTMLDALDGLGLERIAPAYARVGDLIALLADHPLGAIAVYFGNGSAFGYHEDAIGAVVQRPSMMLAAWRVPA